MVIVPYNTTTRATPAASASSPPSVDGDEKQSVDPNQGQSPFLLEKGNTSGTTATAATTAGATPLHDLMIRKV